jgi:hypothetical protein
MSQQGSPFSTQTIFAQPEQPKRGGSNPMGIVGFICSLLGLLTSCCTCMYPVLGLMSLLGLVLSFIAVFKRPRGLAITGIILGAIGVIIALIMVIMNVAMSSVGGFWHMAKAAGAAQTVVKHYNANGSYPASLGAISQEYPPFMTTDKWGNQFVYEVAPDGSEFTIRSMGPDGQDFTQDDVFFGEFIQEPGFTPNPIPQTPLDTGMGEMPGPG